MLAVLIDFLTQNVLTTMQKLSMTKSKTFKATFYFITTLSFINWYTWWPLWYIVIGLLTVPTLLALDDNSSFPKIGRKSIVIRNSVYEI